MQKVSLNNKSRHVVHQSGLYPPGNSHIPTYGKPENSSFEKTILRRGHVIGPRIVIEFNLYSLCGCLLYFGESTLQFWRPKLLSKQESFVFQVLSIYFKTHHRQKSLNTMVQITPSGWCATNSCNSHGLWFASYSPPKKWWFPLGISKLPGVYVQGASC